jgi:hypothetical protein
LVLGKIFIKNLGQSRPQQGKQLQIWKNYLD